MKHLIEGDLPLTDAQKLTLGLPASYRAQHKGAGASIGVKLLDRIRNTTLRAKTQIVDVARKAAKSKWD